MSGLDLWRAAVNVETRSIICANDVVMGLRPTSPGQKTARKTLSAPVFRAGKRHGAASAGAARGPGDASSSRLCGRGRTRMVADVPGRPRICGAPCGSAAGADLGLATKTSSQAIRSRVNSSRLTPHTCARFADAIGIALSRLPNQQNPLPPWL